MSEPATWYRWGDLTFAEVTDPREIAQLDAIAAIDEPEGSCYWAPQATFEAKQYRNSGMGPVQLSELQTRCQAVLGDSEVLLSASALASFIPSSNTLILDVNTVAADTSNLSLRLVDSPAGFEISTDG